MTLEKCLSFEIDGLRFVDSLQFLNCGLDALTKNCAKEGDDKSIHMRRLRPNNEQFKLLLRKRVYPYEYMATFDTFSETRPPLKKPSLALSQTKAAAMLIMPTGNMEEI